MIKVGTDFSGVGAPEQALKELGIEHDVLFSCEKDKYARTTYLANHLCKIMYEDITTRDNNKAPEVDLYCFGFPCQAFSISGKRKGFDDIRGTLFFNAADYIQKKRPKVFIAENVKGLLSHDKPKGSKAKHGRTFSTIINLLAKTINGQTLIPFYEDNLGYNIFYKVLNSKHFGVPQNRERIFIIGFRDDVTYNFPKGFPLEKRLKDILESDVDEKYFLSEKMISCLVTKSEAGKGYDGRFNPDEGNGISQTLTSRYHKMGVTDPYIKVVGEVTPNSQAGIVYSDKGISPTISVGTHGYALGYIETEVISHSLFPRSSKTGKGGTGHLSKNDGTAYALDTGCSQAVEVSVIAQRGRYEEDGTIQQQLEERTDGLTNTITSVQKDNLIKVGNCYNSGGQNGNIYDSEGIAPTLSSGVTNTKGNGGIGSSNSPKIIVQLNPSKESGGKQPYQQNRVYDDNGLAPTLDSRSDQRNTFTNNRIRRLTVRECCRLQGFADTFDISKVSDSQGYKQMGNSITVNVLKAIIGNIKFQKD